jgi:hypothetical protein
MKNALIIIGLFCLSTCFFSCGTKNNPIDNSSTITLPYVLWAGTENGQIYKTNNGQSFDRYVNISSAFMNSIWSVDTNLLYITTKAVVGKGTVPAEKFFGTLITTFNPVWRNNSININSFQNSAAYNTSRKKMYVCSRDLDKLYENDSFATIGNWNVCSFPTAPGNVVSVVCAGDGIDYCININRGIFKRNVGSNNFDPVGTFTGAGTSEVFLSTYNSTLIANPNTGDKVSFSTDQGNSWNYYTGMPAKKVLMGKQLADGKYYSSADSAGLYRLNGTAFESISGGLPYQARIWDIAMKTNVYRGGASTTTYFLATNLGLFKSENNAEDWVKIRDESFTALR